MHDFHELASHYLLLVEGGPPSNYSVWSPDVPGCVATGGTVDEAEFEMRAALEFHLEGLAADGLALPAATGPGVYVERGQSAA